VFEEVVIVRTPHSVIVVRCRSVSPDLPVIFQELVIPAQKLLSAKISELVDHCRTASVISDKEFYGFLLVLVR
jgi:hypothetical protein